VAAFISGQDSAAHPALACRLYKVASRSEILKLARRLRYCMEYKSETILLVDDRPANLVALEAVLSPLRRRLVKAASGREALRFLLHEECALILLDVQMPDLDGFETAALIRARQRTRDTPIIFVTAIHNEEEQVIRGYSLGAVDYIIKPFNAEELVTKVRNFLLQQDLKQYAAPPRAQEAARSHSHPR
jgi:CheY-like chemotaxis protein